MLLSHHHSTCALVSEILESVLQTAQKQFTYRRYILTDLHRWARHQIPNCSPGAAAKMAAHCSGCVFTAVFVHFGWDKCRALIPSIGCHTWPHVTSLYIYIYIYIYIYTHTHIYIHIYIYIRDGKIIPVHRQKKLTMQCIGLRCVSATSCHLNRDASFLTNLYL